MRATMKRLLRRVMRAERAYNLALSAYAEAAARGADNEFLAHTPKTPNTALVVGEPLKAQKVRL